MPRVGNKQLVKSTMEKLKITSKRVCRRATEYLRFLETQLVSRTRYHILTHSARVCICIELATFYYSLPVIRKRLIRMSGLTRHKYNQMYDVYRKSLRIDQQITIAHVCLQLNVVEAVEMAEKIYDFYRKKANDPDFSDKSPQYKVLSVYCACKRYFVELFRLLEIRLQKVHCYDSNGHMTPSAFTALQAKFEEVMNEHHFDSDEAKKNTRSKLKQQDNDVVEDDDELEEEDSDEDSNNKQDIEDYEQWKARILSNAIEQLKLIY